MLKKIPNHRKYVTTNEGNKLTKKNIAERLKQLNLASKNDIAVLVKKAEVDKKLIKVNKKSYFK